MKVTRKTASKAAQKNGRVFPDKETARAAALIFASEGWTGADVREGADPADPIPWALADALDDLRDGGAR